MGDREPLGDRTKVLYIGGYSRSGSTLLLRLLGELPRFVAVGELFDIWDRSYKQNQLCGCGCAFHQCPFWREVTLQAFDCEPADLPADDYQLQRRQMHGLSVPRLWLPILRSARYRADLRSYARILERLYHAISDVSGGRFIIDSSKEPHQAWVLREAPGVELHVVHLVRDSRAVAFSWRRHKARPEIHWGVQNMDRHSVTRSSLEWDVHNFLVSTRQASLASYSLIRYEDLVSRPKLALESLGRAIGETWDLGALFDGRELSLRSSHSASGNPSRFRTGSTSIRRDDEWMEKMPRYERLLSTVLTAPGLVRYGYSLRSGHRGTHR